MNKHKHAENMILYAQDAMETDKPWKRWEFRGGSEDSWRPLPQDPIWYEYCEYRRKPITFPDPPEGEKWHNPNNITPDQLGEGYRLLLESEISNKRDHEVFIQRWNDNYHKWDTSRWVGSSWYASYRVPASTPFHWDKPKPKIRVPLGPEDVPPGCVLRKLNSPAAIWVAPVAVLTTSILHIGNFSGEVVEVSWENLKNHWQILRPGRDSITGWEPCWKEVEQKGEQNHGQGTNEN